MNTRELAAKILRENPEVPLRTLAFGAYDENPGIWTSRMAAESLFRREKTKLNDPLPSTTKVSTIPSQKLEREVNKDTEFINSVSTRITSLDDLIAATEVDLDVWEVERYTVNKWEVGAKDSNGDIVVEPLFQVKAWLRRKPAKEQFGKITDMLLERFRNASPKQRVKTKKLWRNPAMLEIAIFDAHVGKLCWAAETGHDYDTEIAVEEFKKAARHFIDMNASRNIERILFPVGNDFMNSDNSRSETTKGTRQDEDTRWQRSFVEARAALIESVAAAAEVAPVDIVVVSGNHDMERMFYMGDVLAAWHRNDARVTVDNRPTLRKSMRYGNNFLGFTHGNNEKHLDLPLIFAMDYPEEWGAAAHHEIHLGHFHQSGEKVFHVKNDRQRVRLRLISSLASTDAWHKSQGYNGIRAAEAFLFEKQGGCSNHMTYFPQAR